MKIKASLFTCWHERVVGGIHRIMYVEQLKKTSQGQSCRSQLIASSESERNILSLMLMKIFVQDFSES